MNTTLLTTIIGIMNEMDDVQGSALLGYASQIMGKKPNNTPVKQSTPLVFEEDTKKEKAAMKGKAMWQENFITVTNAGAKDYRVYMSVPALLYKKGVKMTKAEAKDRADFLKDKLKAEFKGCGAVWAGNFDNLDIFWRFEKKSDADKYIAIRKEYNKSQGV